MAPIRTTLLISSLALAAAASAQMSTVQLEGSVGAGLTHKNHQTGSGTLNEVSPNLLVASYLRFGGSEDLGGGMKAIFRLEASLNMDTGNPGGPGAGTTPTSLKFFNRQSWVGVDMGRAGTLTLGRQFHAATDRAIRTFDIYNVGGTSLHNTPLGLFGVNRFNGNDTRVDNSVKYRFGMPGVIDLALSYGFGEVVGNGSLGRSYSAEVSQTTALYSIGASVVSFNAPALVATTGFLPKHDLVTVGGNVKLGDFRPYAAYYKSKLDSTVAGRLTQKNSILDLGLAWAGYSQLQFKGNYVDDKGTSLNGLAGRDGHKKTLVLSAEYFLSKRTSLNAAVFNNRFSDGYKLEANNLAGLSRDPTASSVSGYSAGIVHTF
ncbi:MAG: porin [Ideonella sp.]|nr:porin [Ideonella sp.]